MTSDFVRPPEQRYNYRNAISGLFTLVREEGVQGLSRGIGTNLVCSIAFPYDWFDLLTIDLGSQARAILMNVSLRLA